MLNMAVTLFKYSPSKSFSVEFLPLVCLKLNSVLVVPVFTRESKIDGKRLSKIMHECIAPVLCHWHDPGTIFAFSLNDFLQ